MTDGSIFFNLVRIRSRPFDLPRGKLFGRVVYPHDAARTVPLETLDSFQGSVVGWVHFCQVSHTESNIEPPIINTYAFDVRELHSHQNLVHFFQWGFSWGGGGHFNTDCVRTKIMVEFFTRNTATNFPRNERETTHAKNAWLILD